MNGTDHLLAEFVRQRPTKHDATVITYPADVTYSYGELTRWLRDRLPTAEPYFLITESFSGPIAIQIASKSLPNLCGIIFIASFAASPRPFLSRFKKAAGVLSFFSMVSPSLLKPFLTGIHPPQWFNAAFVDAMKTVGKDVMTNRIEEALSVDETKTFKKLSLPMIYIRASHDKLVPANTAKRMAAINHHLLLTEIKGPHFLLQCAPDTAWRKIDEFVGELTRQNK